MNTAKETEEWKKKQKALQKQMSTEAQNINDTLIIDTGCLISTLADPHNGLTAQVKAYWERRLPPPMQGVQEPTIAQVQEALEPADPARGPAQNEWAELEPLFKDIPDPVQPRPGAPAEARPKWTTRLKKMFGKIPWGKLFNGLLRIAGITFLANAFVH